MPHRAYDMLPKMEYTDHSLICNNIEFAVGRFNNVGSIPSPSQNSSMYSLPQERLYSLPHMCARGVRTSEREQGKN